MYLRWHGMSVNVNVLELLRVIVMDASRQGEDMINKYFMLCYLSNYQISLSHDSFFFCLNEHAPKR